MEGLELEHMEGLQLGHKEELEQGLKQGLRQETKQKQLEIARNLKSSGCDFKMIFQNTGVTIEEFQNL